MSQLDPVPGLPRRAARAPAAPGRAARPRRSDGSAARIRPRASECQYGNNCVNTVLFMIYQWIGCSNKNSAPDA